MHREVVERERWVDEATFRRVLGVYQALPGPEATELAVYFGYARRGRLGGLLSGLGFVLPGFVLAVLAAHLYVERGADAFGLTGLLYAAKPVVIALIANAIVRLSKATLVNEGLVLTAVGAALATHLLGLDFVLTLFLLGGLYFAIRRKTANPSSFAFALGLGLANLPIGYAMTLFFLQAGLVTFGGAYTVIPFLEEGAVREFQWITHDQFLDALALCSLLPAPLIIVATFIGYLVWPPWGALVATFFIFLPAFAFTLLLHQPLMRLVENPRVHDLFDGLAAAVIGLIAITAVRLSHDAFPDPFSGALAVAAFAALQVLRANVALVMAGAAGIGILLEALGVIPP